MNKRMINALGAMIVVILLGSLSLYGQSNGTVKGLVKDTTGAILPGASVTLTNKATQRVQTTLSTETGTYVFPALPPGDYSVTAEMPSFKKVNRENVTLNVTEVVTVDFVLELGAVSSEVT